MKKHLMVALFLFTGLFACGGDIETAEDCTEEGGNLQVPPGSCPPGFVSEGNVDFQGDVATCCIPGDRSDVRR